MGIRTIRCLSAVLVLSILAGCGPESFDAHKQRDLKTIATTYFDDVRVVQSYRERAMPYDDLYHRYKGESRSAAAAPPPPIRDSSGTGSSAAGGLIVMGVVAAVVVTDSALRSATESKRTASLNAVLPCDQSVTSRIRASVIDGLARQKYAVVSGTQLKDEDITPATPFTLGMSVRRLTAEDVQSAPKNAQAVLSIDVLNYGVLKLEEMFKEDRFQPYVLVQVQMYRTDSGKCIHRRYYLGLSPAPLPKTNDYDAAIADRAVLQSYYDKAVEDVADLIVRDLRPAD